MLVYDPTLVKKPEKTVSRLDKTKSIELNGAGLTIGIVISRFNKAITDVLLNSCQQELIKNGVEESAIRLINVPGALEIPPILQRLAQIKKCDVLIALGCVIRGETYHFEIVANESARGIMDVQLETGIPIVNSVLTADNEEQAKKRASEKGAYAAQVAIEMASLLKSIPL